MTTHSPVALAELSAEELCVVRHHTDGKTEVHSVGGKLQRVLLRASEAFLARKVIVCEGKTELGFCRGFDQHWSGCGGPSFGLKGVALADGGGNEAAFVAAALASVGYDVAYLGDSDEPISPSDERLREKGVEVFLWDGGVCIEQRVVRDLPWKGVADAVDLAIEELEAQPVRDAVASRLRMKSNELPQRPSDWATCGVDETRLREAIGSAAKEKGWFKRASRSERLARIVISHKDCIEKRDLWSKMNALKEWAWGHE